MANWVNEFLQRNPQYASLEVAQRARHGIHFRRPDGLIEAHFTGKPIHYLDPANGWVPLDTALVDSGKGWFGAPGVPVRIGSDGTVSIEGGSYSQRTSRVGLLTPSTHSFSSKFNLPPGVRNEDSMIAEGTIGGAGWRRVLRLMEDGIREELTLESKPAGLSADAGDWLVLETQLSGLSFPDGWLDEFDQDGMHFPLPSAWDANGVPAPDCRRYARAVGRVQYLYTGIPISWLTSAAYPVVIDPDFVGDTGDAYIDGHGPDYGLARSDAASYWQVDHVKVGQEYYLNVYYYVYRGFLKFDTSSIGSSSTVAQVNLRLTCVTDYSSQDFDVQVVKQNWSAQDPINSTSENTAYSNCLSGAADSSIWRNTAGMTTATQYTSGNLDVSWVNKTGSTYYSLRSDRDYSGTTPTIEEYILVGSQENSTAANRPVLTVVYSTGGTPATVAVLSAAGCTAAAQPPTVIVSSAGQIVAGPAATATAVCPPPMLVIGGVPQVGTTVLKAHDLETLPIPQGTIGWWFGSQSTVPMGWEIAYNPTGTTKAVNDPAYTLPHYCTGGFALGDSDGTMGEGGAPTHKHTLQNHSHAVGGEPEGGNGWRGGSDNSQTPHGHSTSGANGDFSSADNIPCYVVGIAIFFTLIGAGAGKGLPRIHDFAATALPPHKLIVGWPGGSVPGGWAECTGQTVNGVTTPNLRGKFLRGVPNASTAPGVTNENGTHYHSSTHNHSCSGPYGPTNGQCMEQDSSMVRASDLGHIHPVYASTANSSADGHLPPCKEMMFICFVGHGVNQAANASGSLQESDLDPTLVLPRGIVAAWYANATPPSRWYACDSSAFTEPVPRGYGSNRPDIRSRFIRHPADGATGGGGTGGSDTHTHTGPNHSHTTDGAPYVGTGWQYGPNQDKPVSGHTHTLPLISFTNVSVASNVPPYYEIMFVVRD